MDFEPCKVAPYRRLGLAIGSQNWSTAGEQNHELGALVKLSSPSARNYFDGLVMRLMRDPDTKTYEKFLWTEDKEVVEEWPRFEKKSSETMSFILADSNRNKGTGYGR